MGKTAIATLTQKGQTTIPKNVRDYLKIKPHDRIEFVISCGEVIVRPVGTIEANFGKVMPRKKPEDFQTVRSDFEENVAQEQIKKNS
ncbi:MAG: type II toxin-antitoxin system PrlF family antitoxin [Candidatus Schekmanbacteria bacterium]|nr:type II toxin-antitoxin system PrlF family antitoxin [Candidatus Schekmanbacteria bacterium]